MFVDGMLNTKEYNNSIRLSNEEIEADEIQVYAKGFNPREDAYKTLDLTYDLIGDEVIKYEKGNMVCKLNDISDYLKDEVAYDDSFHSLFVNVRNTGYGAIYERVLVEVEGRGHQHVWLKWAETRGFWNIPENDNDDIKN